MYITVCFDYIAISNDNDNNTNSNNVQFNNAEIKTTKVDFECQLRENVHYYNKIYTEKGLIPNNCQIIVFD